MAEETIERPRGRPDHPPDIEVAKAKAPHDRDVGTRPPRHAQVQQVYARAKAITEAIRALPPALLEARPKGWTRGRWGMPAVTPALIKAVRRRLPEVPATSLAPNKINAAWRHIVMVERYPMLTPPVSQARVLAIERVLALIPEGERAQRVTTLGEASTRQLRNAYQEANRQRRRTATRQRRPRHRAPRSTGALWYERLVEIRQHLLSLKQEGLVENLAQSWTPPNLQGYLSELGQVIDELTSVRQRMAQATKTPLRIVGEASRKDPSVACPSTNR